MIAKARGVLRAAQPFDAAMVLASLWFVGGLLVDGWAHSNLDLGHEGFFTPFHAIFYTGFLAVAATVFVETYRRRTPGRPWRASIPAEYDGTLAGLGVFAAGGVLDMSWHLAFGIEQDVAALLSPTHLVLAFGIGLILTGPIRATLAREPARAFAAQWPALVAVGLIGTLVMFFALWVFSTFLGAHSDPHVVFPTVAGAPLAELRESWQIRGMAAIVIRSLVTLGVLVWAARRFALPFGTSVLVVGMPNVLISLMLDPSAVVVAEALIASIAAGLVADLALARGRSFDEGTWRARGLWFATPFSYWTVFVLFSLAFTHGSWWPIPMLAGAPIFAGLAGMLAGIAAERPAPTPAAVHDLPPAPTVPLEAERSGARPNPAPPKRRPRSRAKRAK